MSDEMLCINRNESACLSCSRMELNRFSSVASAIQYLCSSDARKRNEIAPIDDKLANDKNVCCSLENSILSSCLKELSLDEYQMHFESHNPGAKMCTMYIVMMWQIRSH